MAGYRRSFQRVVIPGDQVLSRAFTQIDQEFSNLLRLIEASVPDEIDPVFGASAAAGILPADIAAWNALIGHGHDHGALSGLGDDDHSQYLLAAGTRGLSADWDAGAFGITADHLHAKNKATVDESNPDQSFSIGGAFGERAIEYYDEDFFFMGLSGGYAGLQIKRGVCIDPANPYWGFYETTNGHLGYVEIENEQLRAVLNGKTGWAVDKATGKVSFPCGISDTPGTVPVGTIIPWVGGYFGNGSNGSFSNVLANTVAAVNALLNAGGWYVCDGAALNLTGSPIFAGAGRYLPNLTDERFLQGYTVAGGIGGGNTLPNHTHGVGTLAAANESAHTHQVDPPNTTSGGVSALAINAFQSGSNKSGAQDHTHDVNIPAFASAAGSAHSHALSGSVGNPESSPDNRPKYLNAFYIMRVI